MAGPKTLLKAITSGRTRQVRLLLDLGASTEDVDECGQTPLIRAVFVDNDRNREKMIKMLLKKGSVVSSTDVVGRSALSWACMYGRDKDVATLLEYADVDLELNKVDINGQTALFHAVSSGNAATVKLMVSALRKYDLSTDVPDSAGVSPLMHANRFGYDICASILIYEGNAKVGLGQNNQDKFTRMEKWAISSLRERSRAKNMKRQSQFPPIAAKTDKTTKLSNRRKCHRGRKVMRDSDDESDFSSDGEDKNGAFLGNQNIISHEASHESSPRFNTNVRHCLQNTPPCNIPASILRSSTLSSLCNVSSDNESEVDSVASTIAEGRPVKPTVDLPSMYEYYQEQMSSSFRQPAKKLPEKLQAPVIDVDVTDGTDNAENVPNKKSERDPNEQKWSKLKKNMRLTGLTKMLKANSKTNLKSSPKDNDTPRTGNSMKVIASLPDIYVEGKVHLVRGKE